MKKSDKSKHNICIASIKRSTIRPYDFQWTKYYESNTDFWNINPGFHLNVAKDELVICSTIIDEYNYSILTTQRMIANEKGLLKIGNLSGAIDGFYGDFKDHKNEAFTFGKIKLYDGVDLRYFIETGKASMIMIHGVRTLIRTSQMTNEQIDKVAEVWHKKNEH